MTTLKNGSHLLLEILTEDGKMVLAMTETAFATWRMDSEGNTHHGHYFRQTPGGLQGALTDLEIRANS